MVNFKILLIFQAAMSLHLLPRASYPAPVSVLPPVDQAAVVNTHIRHRHQCTPHPLPHRLWFPHPHPHPSARLLVHRRVLQPAHQPAALTQPSRPCSMARGTRHPTLRTKCTRNITRSMTIKNHHRTYIGTLNIPTIRWQLGRRCCWATSHMFYPVTGRFEEQGTKLYIYV